MADEPAVRSWHGRFAMVPVALIESPLSQTAKCVYTALAVYADTSGRCFPGIGGIADRIGVNRRTVERALNDLKKAGWVNWEPRYWEDGGRASNGYTLTRPGGPSGPHAANLTGPCDTDVAPPYDMDVAGTRPTTNRQKTSSSVSAVTDAQKVATEVYEQDRRINYVAVMKIAGHMLKAGESPARVASAMKRVLEAGKPITIETVRVAMGTRRRRNEAPWEVS